MLGGCGVGQEAPPLLSPLRGLSSLLLSGIRLALCGFLGRKDEGGVYFGKWECAGGLVRSCRYYIGEKKTAPIRPPPPPRLFKQRDSPGAMDP